MFYFAVYLFVAFVFSQMVHTMYIFPWFKGSIVLGPQLASFLWPLSLTLTTYHNWFGKKDL